MQILETSGGGMLLVSAYILTKVEAGKDKEVFKEVKELEGVKKVNITYGSYDLIVEVGFEKIQELDKFVFYTLRLIPQVKETMTIICVET